MDRPDESDEPDESANPDAALLRRFLASPGDPLRVDSNPLATALGMTLVYADRRADPHAKTLEVGFAPQALFVQGSGVLQGGAIVAMLDFAMAFAAMMVLPPGSRCGTSNLVASFVRAAPQGRYVAVATIEKQGRTLVFCSGRLMREEDRSLVATASSTLVIGPARASSPAS